MLQPFPIVRACCCHANVIQCIFTDILRLEKPETGMRSTDGNAPWQKIPRYHENFDGRIVRGKIMTQARDPKSGTLTAIVVAAAIATFATAATTPALADYVVPDPVLSPDAVKPDPALSPDQTYAAPALSPDAIRPDRVLSPNAIKPDRALSPDQTYAAPALSPDAAK
jgi:hypothetical protein